MTEAHHQTPVGTDTKLNVEHDIKDASASENENVFSDPPTADEHCSDAAVSTYRVKPSPENTSVIVIAPMANKTAGAQDAPPAYDTKPSYSAAISKLRRPNVSLFRGSTEPENLIGDASYHSWRSNRVNMKLHDKAYRMRMNLITWNYWVNESPLGKLKWQVTWSGRALNLRDDKGKFIARMEPSSVPGLADHKLELFVPVDDTALEYIILAALTTKTFNRVCFDCNTYGAFSGPGIL